MKVQYSIGTKCSSRDVCPHCYSTTIYIDKQKDYSCTTCHSYWKHEFIEDFIIEQHSPKEIEDLENQYEGK